MSRRTLQRFVAKHEWERLLDGVLAAPFSESSYERRAMAALLHVCGGAQSLKEREILIAGRSAAAILQISERRPHPVILVRPWDGAPRSLVSEVHVVRSRTLVLPRDRTRRRSLDITAPTRTLVDLAAHAGFDELLDVGAAGLQRRLYQPAALTKYLRLLRCPRGLAKLQELAATLEELGTIDSGFEKDVRLVVTAAGMKPVPSTYALVHDGITLGHLDLAYPEVMVYLEADGFGFHALPSQLQRDHVRANEIVARTDWIAVRVTKREWNHHRERFLRQLRQTLERRRAAVEAGLLVPA